MLTKQYQSVIIRTEKYTTPDNTGGKISWLEPIISALRIVSVMKCGTKSNIQALKTVSVFIRWKPWTNGKRPIPATVQWFVKTTFSPVKSGKSGCLPTNQEEEKTMEEAVFYMVCFVVLYVWTKFGINKYVYNYDSYDYNKNMDWILEDGWKIPSSFSFCLYGKFQFSKTMKDCKRKIWWNAERKIWLTKKSWFLKTENKSGILSYAICIYCTKRRKIFVYFIYLKI